MNSVKLLFFLGRTGIGVISIQIIAQSFMLVCGLIVVRMLDHDQYAAYTLIGMAIASGALLCDMGVSAAVTTFRAGAEGSRSVGGLRGEAEEFRRKFTLVALAALTLAGAVALSNREVRLEAVATITVMIVIAAVQSRVVFLKAWLAGEGKPRTIVLGDATAQFARVSLITGMFVLCPKIGILGPLSAWLMLVALQRWLYRRSANLPGAERDLDIHQRIRRFIAPLWINYAYHALGGLLPGVTLGFAGQIQSIAEYGALTRLCQVFAVFYTVNNVIVQPFVARGKDTDIVRRILLALSLAAFAMSVIIASGFLVPSLWLLMLGPGYAHLTREVGPILLGSGMMMLGGTIYSATLATGVTNWQMLSVIAGILAQAIFLTVHPLESASDAISLTIVTGTTSLLMQAVLLAQAIRKRTDKTVGVS
jgi:hypothetical protein